MRTKDRNNSDTDRVKEALRGQPQLYSDLMQSLGRAKSTVDGWLRKSVRDGDVFYVYAVPEEITEWRRPVEGIRGRYRVTVGQEAFSPNVRNNLSPKTPDRYYCRTVDVPLLRAEHSSLFQWDGSYTMSVTFGLSSKERSTHRTYGGVETVTEGLFESLGEGRPFYATISVNSLRPVFTVLMTYQGRVSEPVIGAVLDNVQAVANRVAHHIDQESVCRK